jgi:hypothetical protein
MPIRQDRMPLQSGLAHLSGGTASTRTPSGYCAVVMRRLLATTAVMAVALIVMPHAAQASPDRFDLGFVDPYEFQESDPIGAYATMRDEGARVVRLPITWREVAANQPAHPTDPNDPAYNWALFDHRIDKIRSHGMQPLLSLYTAPRWAHAGPRLTANPGAYGDFARAIATRYSGAAGQRPRIKYFQLWNEPNLYVFLDDTPARYREMVNAAYKGIKAVHGDNVVVAGGLAPFSDPGNKQGIGPFPYMRSVLCMSGGAHPHATCSAKTSFDIWATHPYTSGGPNHSASVPQDASLGDLPEMRRLLLAAKRAGHIKSNGNPGFWITEFGWDSKPPDPGGVPLAQHARWTAEAMYRMWESDVNLLVWFKLRDDPFNGDWGSGFQGGVYFNTTALYSNEKAKPAAQVLRFPFVAVPEGGRVSVWGRTPGSHSGKVTIQMQQGSSWRKIATVGANGHGLFRLKLNGRRGTTLRASVGGASSYPFKATNTKDVGVRPFGGT